MVEPATPFVPNWHIDVICEHLQAVTDGQVRNLIINIPPRHMKSLLVSVLWPTWEWTFAPARRWLFASYALSLAIRDSLKCRRLIESPWYQGQWGDGFRLTSDQNQKARFENDRTGYRLAVGVGGAATGEGGDRLVCDDPVKAQDADSDAMREGANDWWDQTMSTRGNDPQTVAKVVVMQRLHEQDLTGHLLAKMAEGGEPYEHLCLPARYEPRVTGCGLGQAHDPRTAPDALLWPDRFPEPAVRGLEVALGERSAAGQLQQRPAPAGGGVFKQAWWANGRNRYDAAAERPLTQIIGYWLTLDTAFKDHEDNDYTACGVLELWPDYRLALREVWAARLQFPDLLRDITTTAARYYGTGLLRGVVIEDKGAGTSAGQSLRQGAEPWLAGLLTMFQPQGSKVYRARQASLWTARDCVLLPHPSDAAPWLYDFERQLYTFPAAAHDDMVDMFSQGILFLENLLAAGFHARGGTVAAA